MVKLGSNILNRNSLCFTSNETGNESILTTTHNKNNEITKDESILNQLSTDISNMSISNNDSYKSQSDIISNNSSSYSIYHINTYFH